MTAQAHNEAQYFDLHTTGIGYLNSVRVVTPQKGSEYLACTISALRGNKQAAEYTPFQLRVSGEEAKKVLTDLQDDVNDRDTKVLISFRIGDAMPEWFEYSKGERKGEIGTCIRGRLIKVFWVKVNGEYAYQAPKAEASEDDGHVAEDQPEVQSERASREQASADGENAPREFSRGRGAPVKQANGSRRSSGGYGRRAA